MKARANLSDPPTSKWDSHFAGEIHALILIGASTPADRLAERNAMLARIAATAGAVTLLIDNKPTGNVGLLFMAYKSSLEEQFEFTQAFWVNNPDFRTASTGIDPVIGQPAGQSGQKWPVIYGSTLSDGRAADDFSGFVTLRGGEYFFAPSISYLKSLAS